jgi:glycosyltransferase involved in cell wall biosynthesis
MNLLYTLTAYPPSTGGAQLHQHLLARNLSDRHCIQVVTHWTENRTDWLLGTTLRATGQPCDYQIDGIAVHQLALTPREKWLLSPFVLGYYPFMAMALPRIAASVERQLQPYAAKADLLHNVRIGREGLTRASLQAARQRDIPFVLTPVHHPRWSGWRYRAYQQLYRMADRVIALTNVEKQILITLGVCEENIAVTGNGPVLAENADADSFLRKHRIEGPAILFVGQHFAYKGYRQLLQAANLVWERMPDAEFVFIGPPVRNSEWTYAANADRRIHRLGTVSLQEKTDALAACTLLCVPSTQESFGGVYTEAWSFGKPVIGCNIPAVAEVITDGVDGCLVEQESAQIADRICWMLLNPSKAEAMGRAGQAKVAAHYTWQRLASCTEQVYESVLRGSARAS